MKLRNRGLLGILVILTWVLGFGLERFARANSSIKLISDGKTEQAVIERFDPWAETVLSVPGVGDPRWNYSSFFHYDGTNWKRFSSSMTFVLVDVDMISTADGWAVGNVPFAIGTFGDSVILHYNGSSWQSVPAPIPSSRTLWAIDMLSATDGWAVGEFGVIFHYNGIAWEAVTSPTTWSLYDVDMVAPDDVWAVGNYPFGVPPGTGGDSVILHYDGNNWKTVPTPARETLWAIDMLSASEGWAVGNGGIFHYNGVAWETVSSPTPGSWSLYDVYTVAADDVWAVGLSFPIGPGTAGSGAIMHYDGDTWQSVPSPADAALYSIDMLSANDGWAAGDDGVVLHYNGIAWQIVTDPEFTDYDFRNVHMVSASDGWIVGNRLFTLQEQIYLPIIVKNR